MVTRHGRRPRVLITTDRRDGGGLRDGPRVRPIRPEVFLGERVIALVRDAGGLPLLIPPGEDDVDALLDTADAVILTGGYFDIHPSLYGEAVEGRLDRVEPARTATELRLARGCLGMGIPILGICGGMQAMAVAAGGKLIQDLPKDRLDHEQPNDPAEPSHRVRVSPQGQRYLPAEIQVNSTHHQAVREPGRGLVAAGWSDDAVIEVIVSTLGFAVGVQWHPETLGDPTLFRALLAAAASR